MQKKVLNKQKEELKNLHVITGSMFAGKTEFLIKKINALRQKDCQKVLVLKPEVENRFAHDQIVSHLGQKLSAIPIKTENFFHQVKKLLKENNYDVIAIDEFHFFTLEVVGFVEKFLKKYTVLISGLNRGVCQNNLEVMNQILVRADFIHKLNGKCKICNRLGSQILPVNSFQFKTAKVMDFVGGQEKYTLLCHLCASLWQK